MVAHVRCRVYVWTSLGPPGHLRVTCRSPAGHLVVLRCCFSFQEAVNPLITLKTLGAVDLQDADGRSLASVLSQPKRLALLVYLATANGSGFRRRDTLLALFWPELDEERARGALKQATYYLRRSLGSEVIVARGNDELGVDPACLSCDMVQFLEALDKGDTVGALELYQGDFLEGFHAAETSESFEDWLHRERNRLRERAGRAASALAEAAETRADSSGAVEWARKAVRLSETDETAIRHLIGVLDRSGDRAGALRVYDEFARHLRDAFEAEPAAETQTLIQQVRTRPGSGIKQAPMAEQATPEPAAPPVTVQTATEPRPSPTRKRQWTLSGWGAAAAAVVLVAVAFAISNKGETTLVPNRVLVATLENRTGDPKLDIAGSMASDWITQGLQESGLVEVIDPSTALLTHRSIAMDTVLAGFAQAQAAAEVTRSAIVVWGSYYKENGNLLFKVQVSNAGNGKVLRSLEPISGPADDVAGILPMLRQRVAGALAATLDDRLATLSPPSTQPPTLEAYQAYVSGLEFFSQRKYKEAAPDFHRAAELDSTFMLPRFWELFALGNSGQGAKRDSLLAAMVPLRDKLSPLDQHSLDFFVAYSQQDVLAALHHVRQAAKLAPLSNWTYMVANLGSRLGRPREALQALDQLDPERGWIRGWDQYWAVKTSVHHQLGQFEEQLTISRRERIKNPKRLVLVQDEIAALAALGRIDELRTLIAEIATLPQEELSSANLSDTLLFWVAASELRAHGHRGAAEELLREGLAWWDKLPAEERNEPRQRDGYAQTLYHLGRWQQAESVFQQLSAERPKDRGLLMHLAATAWHRGDHATFNRLLRQIEDAADPRSESQMIYIRARFAALQGDRVQATALLRYGLTRGLNPSFIHRDVDLESLRGYPPFEELFKEQ